ncbi:MAG: hypothetical protein HN368_01715 [Spirochaetales bacterium]|jgi:uroporphyrinogen decarboxylase|nr:hypothetical protein [Spirochaetales bacterium]
MFGHPRNDSEAIVTQALSFERPDRMPVFDSFWDGFIENWRTTRNPPLDMEIEDYYWTDLAVPVANETLFPTRMSELGKDGEYVLVNDGWGRVIRTKPGTYFSEPVERVFNSPSDLDKMKFDPADLDSRYEKFTEQVRMHKSKNRAVFVKIGGPFIRCSFFRGETEFLMDMATDESFASAQVEMVGEHLLQIGLESLRRANAYDFGVWIYDDMCNLRSPMFSPRIFEKIYLPVYRRMISTLKAAGAKWVMLHCDGNLLPFLDMLIDAGIDGINPVEHAAGMDVIKLMEQYGRSLRYIGGVCNSRILPGGDKARIREHVQAIVEAGRNGGLVIGTHTIGPDIPVVDYELYREIIAGG